MKPSLKRIARLLCPMFLTAAGLLHAEPSLIGQSGLIHMPDARIGQQDDLQVGYGYVDPYFTFWTSVAFLPRWELSARYTRVSGVSALSTSYGSEKDKAFDSKLLLLTEGSYWPALAIGYQDFLGNQLFEAKYLVASKKLGPVDLTLGAGSGRIKGAFGGARYRINDQWALVGEYNAIDTSRTNIDQTSDAHLHRKGPAAGVEYRWGWLGAQASYSRDAKWGLNAFVDVPLNAREFIPKIDEPAPYIDATPRPTAKEWQTDPQYLGHLRDELVRENFRNIAIEYRGDTLKLALTNSRISDMNRAVGRAARVATALAPIEMRRIEITYGVNDTPVVTYAFGDSDKLVDYFGGVVGKDELAPTVERHWSDPKQQPAPPEYAFWSALADAGRMQLQVGEEGDVVRLKAEDAQASRIRVAPYTRFFFNDPSGALKYELGLVATYYQKLAQQTWLHAGVAASLLENVSDVTQPSNSQLPHVRSDIANYMRARRYRVDDVTVSRLFNLAPGWYARASGGLYEQMYGGAGGQVLYYLPNWPVAFDVNVDWVKQRDPQRPLGFRDYQTLTGFFNTHVELPLGLSATARIGRFLAKDTGVRLELQRRFNSGVTIGGWYTRTNGHDVTSPGSPDSPYYDKGFFVSIPLDIMLTKDTKAGGTIALSPWTRDVGQMVYYPSDLYNLLHKSAVVDYNEPNWFDALNK